MNATLFHGRAQQTRRALLLPEQAEARAALAERVSGIVSAAHPR